MKAYEYKLPDTVPDEVIHDGKGRIWHQTYEGLRTSVRHLLPGTYELIIPTPELMFVHDGEVSVRTMRAKKDGYGSMGYSSEHVFAPQIGEPVEFEVRDADYLIWDHSGHSGVDGLTYTSFHPETAPEYEEAIRLAVENLGGGAVTSTLGILRSYFRNQMSE